MLSKDEKLKCLIIIDDMLREAWPLLSVGLLRRGREVSLRRPHPPSPSPHGEGAVLRCNDKPYHYDINFRTSMINSTREGCVQVVPTDSRDREGAGYLNTNSLCIP